MSKKSAQQATTEATTEATTKATTEANAEGAAQQAAPEANAEASDVRVGEWPRQFKVTNNTPVPMHLSEAGVFLTANYQAPGNTAVVTYTSQDALTRELANAQAIGKAHNFSDEVLLVEETD